MANIILTSKCQRSCPYCFAEKGDEEMSQENFNKVLEFCSREPRMNNIGLMGGEPTLHPNFMDFFKTAISKGFIVNVFTNGMIEENLLNELKEYGEKTDWSNFSIFLNVNDPDTRTGIEKLSLYRTLRALHEVIFLSYNIHHADCDLNFLVDIIKEYKTQLVIRLGIAHPNRDKTNTFMTLEDCRKVRDAIVNISRNRNIMFDCGFPRCMFTEDDLERLFPDGIIDCGPVIDILPDLTVIHCFPLIDKKVNLLDFDNFDGLRKGLILLDEDNLHCISDECNECDLFNRLCGGGCKAH